MKKRFLMLLLCLTTMLVLGASSVALASPNIVPNGPMQAGQGDAADNGIDNANKTGLNVTTNDGTAVNDVIKSDGMNLKFDKNGVAIEGAVTQRTHGEYQENTNSCASCHQTHTGASDKLLFKNGVYNTCTACHDGTLGFYNVFTPSTAGTFSGTVAGNASVHMANGTMEVKAAPGGNRTGTQADGTTEMENWVGEFTCASCHSPHGSYSDRLLNYNPNHIAATPMFDDAAGTITGTPNGPLGGNMVRGAVVTFASLPTLASDATAFAAAPAYVTVEGTAQQLALTGQVLSSSTSSGIQTLLVDADVVVAVLKKGTSAYAKDTSPWLAAGEYNHAHTFKVAFTNFISSGAPLDLNSTTNTQITAGLTFNYQKGFVKNTGATLVGKSADIARAFITPLVMDSTVEWFGAVNTGVKITQTDVKAYSAATTTQEKANAVAITTFCAACHTDYMAKSADTDGTGVWSKAFRHTTDSSNYTCLKCHFAHGSDVSVILDAQDRGITRAATELFAGDTTKATAYLLDQNASSALKRYTNMSVCWKCHTSSANADFVQNDYFYNVKTDTNTANDLTNGFVAPANSALPYFKAPTDIVTP